MPVVYRVKKVYVCRLTMTECRQPHTGPPDCRAVRIPSCPIYKAWMKSGFKAKDYASQKRMEDFENVRRMYGSRGVSIRCENAYSGRMPEDRDLQECAHCEDDTRRCFKAKEAELETASGEGDKEPHPDDAPNM